jgi:hypothetical protein
MSSTNGPLNLYTYARNVLVKYINCTSSSIFCPLQIAGEDIELWKKFIARDFGIDAVDKFAPKNLKSWSKVYDVPTLQIHSYYSVADTVAETPDGSNTCARTRCRGPQSPIQLS